MGKKKRKNKAAPAEAVKPAETVSSSDTVQVDLPASQPTQEFNTAEVQSSVPLYELVRTSSAVYAYACKKCNWFSLRNTHLVVYIMFFLVIAVFDVYYGFFNKDITLCIVTSVAALFMLYVIARGPKLFSTGMSFDEEHMEGTLSCSFYKDNMSVKWGSEAHDIPYSSVTEIKFAKHFVYISVKNNKALQNGIVMEKPVEKETADGIMNIVKNAVKKA